MPKLSPRTTKTSSASVTKKTQVPSNTSPSMPTMNDGSASTTSSLPSWKRVGGRIVMLEALESDPTGYHRAKAHAKWVTIVGRSPHPDKKDHCIWWCFEDHYDAYIWQKHRR